MEFKVKEFKGQNQQIVFDLIMEFVENKDNLIIEEEYRKNFIEYMMEYLRKELSILDVEMRTLIYIFRLRGIASDYILLDDFSEEILIAKISEKYFKKIYSKSDFLNLNIPYEDYKKSGYNVGIREFIELKNALITERDVFGYKNLLIACEIEIELSKKK